MLTCTEWHTTSAQAPKLRDFEQSLPASEEVPTSVMSYPSKHATWAKVHSRIEIIIWCGLEEVVHGPQMYISIT